MGITTVEVNAPRWKEENNIVQTLVVSIPQLSEPDLSFNHVVRAGNFLFLTSQLSADLKTGKIIPGEI